MVITKETLPPLLTTKLHKPPLRPALVARRRLTAKLDRVWDHKLTLVTAPAGFGKTTLLRAWVDGCTRPVGWLALDEQDNSLPRFLFYLIHACRDTDSTLGREALALLRATHQPHPTTLLTHLTNDLAARPDSRLFILDDYHAIHNQAIHEALDFFIAHLPAHIRLIIAGRSQPPLSLARLRGQAHLLELTSAELRFTAAEVDTFLTEVMHLDLSPAERTTLEMRTEGWIAGLQLAGLSLQKQANPAAFIAAFSGTDRTIGDYLFEEVLRHQSPAVQRFLRHTAILEQLCGPLCDALLDDAPVVGGLDERQVSGQAMLEFLDQANLFIIPLDHQRQWYRYHHLLADFLRQRLAHTAPAKIPELHRRASVWFEQQGSVAEAIRHGLQAQDFERTAGLVEMAFQRRDWVDRAMNRLLDWFEALPEYVTHARLRLQLGAAWLRLEIFADQWPRIEAHLRHVETILTGPEVDRSFSENEVQTMLAEVDLLRANHARHRGDPAQVIDLCQQALDRLPSDEVYLRSGTLAHLASAYDSLGQMTPARQMYTDSLHLCRRADNVDGYLFAAARLMEVLMISGHLRQAAQLFDQVQAAYGDERTGPDMGQVYISRGDLYRQQNQLDQAKIYLERGLALCRPFAAWHAAVTAGVISLAQVLAASGHFDEAIRTLNNWETQAPPLATAEIRLATTRARLLLGQGDVAAAIRAIERVRSTSPAQSAADFEYAHEVDDLIVAEVLLAQTTLEREGLHPISLSPRPIRAADELLGRLYQAALAGGRLGRMIEIRLLQAISRALQETNRATAEALHYLEEALSLAEREGYIRLFVDKGPLVHHLLTLALTNPAVSVSLDYIRTLLVAFPPARHSLPPATHLTGHGLTRRERVALRLLASERSIEEIAAEMTISVSSVRTYTKRIYSKLAVHSRAEAVYRAKALNLLGE